MKSELREQIVAKTNELMAAPSCSPDTKAACERWLLSLNTDEEADETKLYVQELSEAVMPIDDLIAFACSDTGKDIFGEETARNIADHAKEIKADGAEYCDCDACAAALEILEHKDDMVR